MIHKHPNNRHNNNPDHNDDNDNHNYRHNLNKTTKKRRRISVRQNLFDRNVTLPSNRILVFWWFRYLSLDALPFSSHICVIW